MRIIAAVFVFVLSLVPLTRAAEPSVEEILSKARQYLGGDEALDRIQSIAYEGVFETGEGVSGDMTIVFQKPLQQRVEIIRGELGEVTALNDLDAWRKVYHRTERDNWSLTILDVPQIRELQANTLENLYFFRGIHRQFGRIEHRGRTQVDGRDAVELVFNYGRGILFFRFFDIETGRLLMTRTHQGAELRETGEQRIEGVLFPEQITMTRDGELLNTIRFVSIRLNEQFPDSLFEIPSLAP